MADQMDVILEKLTTIEEVLEQMLPLMTALVARLEGQRPPHDQARVATYADLYPVTEAGPPEGDLVARRVGTGGQRTMAPGWWGRLFQETRP